MSKSSVGASQGASESNTPFHDFSSSSAPKSNHPIDQIPTNLGEEETKLRVNKIIAEWEQGINEKKNLLFLLTTLHEVWTNDTSLGTISMQDLVNNKASVKTYYKKAMRSLHPDKNKTKDFKTQYIASCLYQILNEANSIY